MHAKYKMAENSGQSNKANEITISGCKNNISEDDPKYQLEANRYHLYASYGCSFAH